MKRRLAHALKRTARTLIKWANRIDGPVVGGPTIQLADTHVYIPKVWDPEKQHQFITIAPPGGIVNLTDSEMREAASDYARHIVGPPPRFWG